MRKSLQKVKNKQLFLKLYLPAVLIVSLFISGLAPATYAVSAVIELEISGIECDLAALYVGKDPSAVVVPAYCNNKPQPTSTAEPTVSAPISPSFSGFTLQSQFAQPSRPQGVNVNNPKNNGLITVDYGREPKPSDFVTETLLIALIAATSIMATSIAINYFANKSRSLKK